MKIAHRKKALVRAINWLLQKKKSKQMATKNITHNTHSPLLAAESFLYPPFVSGNSIGTFAVDNQENWRSENSVQPFFCMHEYYGYL